MTRDAQPPQPVQLALEAIGQCLGRRGAVCLQQTHTRSDAKQGKLDSTRRNGGLRCQARPSCSSTSTRRSPTWSRCARFERVGAPGQLLEVWFASTLRDGFALTAAGAYADSRTVAAAVLRGQLAQVTTLQGDQRRGCKHVLAGFGELDVHPDISGGIRRLADAGIRMATLTNGAAELAATLLERAGLADLVERYLSVDEVQRWKPAPEPYLHAARECDVAPEQCALIAVHPWDIDGAKRAGLQAGWLNRPGGLYPDFFQQPDATADTLGALAEVLVG